MTRKEEIQQELHTLQEAKNKLYLELEAINYGEISVAEHQIRELLHSTEINKETLELARSRQRR